MSEITDNIIIPNIPQFANFINDLRLVLIQGINTERAKSNLELIAETSSLEYAVNTANSMLSANNASREELVSGINTYKVVPIDTTSTLETAVDTANYMIADADASRRLLIQTITNNATTPFPEDSTLNDAIAQTEIMFQGGGGLAGGYTDYFGAIIDGKHVTMSAYECEQILNGKYAVDMDK